MIKSRAIAAAAVLAAVLIVVGVLTNLPQTVAGYQKQAVKACQDAEAAVRTAQLVARADVDGKSLPGYSSRALSDALDKVSSAAGGITAAEVPQGTPTVLREQATGLVVSAATKVADIQSVLSSGDPGRIREQVRQADALGRRLDDFVRRYR